MTLELNHGYRDRRSDAEAIERWSGRRRVAFMLLICGAAWALVVFGVAKLF